MKKELRFFAWNAFLVGSLFAAKFLGVGFPVTIVGVFAVAELVISLIGILCIGDKSLRAGIRKEAPFNLFHFIAEMVFIALAIYCENKKISAVWIMNLLLQTAIVFTAESKKEEDEKPTDAA